MQRGARLSLELESPRLEVNKHTTLVDIKIYLVDDRRQIH